MFDNMSVQDIIALVVILPTLLAMVAAVGVMAYFVSVEDM